MKNLSKILIVAVVMLALAAPLSMAHEKGFRIQSLTRFDSPIHMHERDEITVRLKGGSLFFINKDELSEVEITEDYELYIDDLKIETNAEQKEMLKKFHTDFYGMIDFAKEIGIEGAKIGLNGAAVGFKAIACVFKLLSPDYDTDDLEREVELAAKSVERKADKLERKAEKIEDMVDELEVQADDLVREIPELKKLDWF